MLNESNKMVPTYMVWHFLPTVLMVFLDCVHTMPAHFENDEKCDGSIIWASVHTMPEQFENGGNLTVRNSLQDFDAKKMYLHPKNQSVSCHKCRKIFCFHHFQVFTECCFQNVPVRAPFSKSTVFEIYRQRMCRFVWTGGLSVTFFTVFKIRRHHVNAALIVRLFCEAKFLETLLWASSFRWSTSINRICKQPHSRGRSKMQQSQPKNIAVILWVPVWADLKRIMSPSMSGADKSQS